MKKVLLTMLVAAIAFGQQNANNQKRPPSQAKATRSGQAADILAKNGFKVAGTIGAQTYEEQGGKLTKIVAPPPRNTAVTEKE